MTEPNLDEQIELMKAEFYASDLSPKSFDLTIGIRTKMLIATQKAQLLDRVGKDVIGEDERLDIQSDFDKIDVPHLETDRFPGLDGVRQASRNILKKHQRTALNKLKEEQ